MWWFISYEGLTGAPTAMHFHGTAAAGQAAGVDLGIGTFDDSSSVGSATLTADQVGLLRSGLWYLNIHTAANGGGEIRGQVELQDGITIFDFPITAAQAVNDIELDDATPSGNALVTFHAESGLAKWSINYDGLTGPPVAMHFHGPALAGEATGLRAQWQAALADADRALCCLDRGPAIYVYAKQKLDLLLWMEKLRKPLI